MDNSVQIRGVSTSEPALPAVVEAATRRTSIVDWIAGNRPLVTDLLHEHGGVLFRGFRINGTPHFERVMTEGFGGPLLDYQNRSTPRSVVKGRIFTSTEYPADQSIPLHNENSYTTQWARKIFFYCVTPSTSGGQTPIADSRKVYERIPRQIRERFERHGVCYQRNYNGLDLSWQEVFQTESKSEMEAYCRGSGIRFEWVSDSHLRTRQVCQASAIHPHTGVPVWFNQAHLFHVSNLGQDLRGLLAEAVDPEDLPRHAQYGDGSEIEESDLQLIRDAYEAEKILFDWQAGDILVLDNMLAAHGREPFEGPRKVVVGMIEPHHALSEVA